MTGDSLATWTRSSPKLVSSAPIGTEIWEQALLMFAFQKDGSYNAS
jgi:hypothetical protein